MAAFETWEDAVIGAKHRAKVIGVAYAVRWPCPDCDAKGDPLRLGHFTVEDRKPSLRNQNFRILECFENGSEQLA